MHLARGRAVALAAIAAGMTAACAACGSLPRRQPSNGDDDDEDAPRLVAMERTKFGGQLVVLAENGDRMEDLTPPARQPARDNSPAWSPDGRTIAFVSSRDREDLARTSLWIMQARAGSSLVRLTTTAGDVVDRDPAWLPGGRGLVFSSNRDDAAGRAAGPSFDLWRLDLVAGEGGALVAAGAPVRLTATAGHELHPSVSPDNRVVYALVETDGSASALWRLSLDDGEGGASGAPQRLTAGPFDVTPSWSPDGKTIAFGAPQTSNPKAIKDADLYAVDADGGDRRVLLEEMGDETGPVWSSDGRYLFATSVYRSVDTGKPVLSSVVFIDLEDGEPDGKHVVRALHDSAGPVQRASPAIAPSALAHAVLAANQPYAEAVKDAVFHYLQRRADELESQGLLPER